MKKLQKKTGRRASRKRERMSRLVTEVCAERKDCDDQVRESDDETSRSESPVQRSSDSAGAAKVHIERNNKLNSPARDCGLNPEGKSRSSSRTFASEKSVEETSPPSDQSSVLSIGRLQKLPTTSDRSSKRRSRMKKIRQELARQTTSGIRCGPESLRPGTEVSQVAETSPASAVQAVQTAVSASSSGNDPTAQSMVAIAGAVTALASAIQFRLTDDQSKPKSFSETPEVRPSATAVTPLPATEAKPERSETAATASVQETEPEVAARSPKAVSTSSSLADSPGVCPDTRSGEPSALAAGRETLPQHSRRAPSAHVPAFPDSQAHSADVSEFDSSIHDSFFDEDESDVAGAYSVLPPSEEPEESYRDWFRRVVVRNKWLTWFTAFYVHWLLVLLMMIVFVHGPEQAASLFLNGAFAESVAEEPETFEMSVSEPSVQEESEPEPAVEPVVDDLTISEMAEESVAISDSILDSLNKEAITDQTDSAETSEMTSDKTPPAPAHSVSQGSFSVWTDPEYPSAGEPYRIVVQIQLPPGTKSYHLRDLNGVVVGSDGYRKPIPGINPTALPIVDGCVRFIIPIVSADAQVRDTVFIRSKLLKETQKLLIEF